MQRAAQPATDTPSGVALRGKAVPGASRDQLAGVLGDRLKVRVAAPPEGGKANDAIVRVLAEALNVPLASITISSGHTGAEKTLLIRGLDAPAVRSRLNLPSQ